MGSIRVLRHADFSISFATIWHIWMWCHQKDYGNIDVTSISSPCKALRFLSLPPNMNFPSFRSYLHGRISVIDFIDAVVVSAAAQQGSDDFQSNWDDVGPWWGSNAIINVVRLGRRVLCVCAVEEHLHDHA